MSEEDRLCTQSVMIGLVTIPLIWGQKCKFICQNIKKIKLKHIKFNGARRVRTF